jgi:GT2 family glycosyltransferase
MLLNDDAVLETPGGFSGLAAVAKAEPGFGLISAACNNVGNINQWRRPGGGLRQEARMVCFVSVFIPRATIDKVGLLDPIFTGYGFEDDDYSVRVRRAGLKIGIWDGCFVDHSKLRSTFRDYGVAGATELASGAKIFREKWGTDNWSV